MRNRSQKLVVSVLFAGLAVLVLLFAGSCGGRSPTPAAAISSSAHQGSSVEDSSFLKEELKRLDELPLPEGVDPKLWASLKERMRNFLTDRYSGKQSSYYEDYPYHTHFYVVPRELNWESDVSNGKLNWIYVNDGDYDQGSTVGLEDITPVAIHYDEEVTANNTIQELIDEDDETDHTSPYNGDDLVDTELNKRYQHDDILTIERNYGVVVDHYKILGSTTGGDPWTEVATVDFTDHDPPLEGEDRYRFHWDIPNTDYAHYIVKACDEDGTHYTGREGGEDVVMQAYICLLPVVTEVKPPAPQGIPHEEITFEATVEGPEPEPFTYFWTFCEHASPRESTDATPLVTFDEVVVGTGTVCVSNIFGDSEVFEFPIEIVLAPEIVSIFPTEGDAGAEVTFSADVRGSEPFTYAWDFGGGATPNASSDESPTVTLGDPGPPYSASLTVTNDFGEDTKDFDLTVHGWVIETIDENPYAEFTSLAFAPDGNPGICYYSWSEKSVRYMKFNGNEWTEEALLPTDSGDFTSLAYDSDGTAYVAYMMDPPDDVPALALAWQEGAEWLHVIIDTDHAGHSLSLSLHPVTEEPAISYVKCQASEGDLLYAHMVDHEWLIEDVGGATACTRGTSLAFTPVTCNPAISFCHNITGSALVYASKNEGNWQLETVEFAGDPLAGLGQYSCLGFGPNGEPSVSYHHSWNTELRYAAKYAGNWRAPEVVDGEGFGPPLVGEWTSLAFDAEDKAVISYTQQYTDGDYDLRLARQTGAQPAWATETVDSAYKVGKYTSIAIGPYGSIGISYGGDDLRFAQLW